MLLRLDACTLRTDVSDSRGECRPTVTGASEAERGRGLPLVDVPADRWGVFGRVPVGTTVRAEPALPPRGKRSLAGDDFARG
ncbi:ATP-binding protein [Streptomyces violaceorubidus]